MVSQKKQDGLFFSVRSTLSSACEGVHIAKGSIYTDFAGRQLGGLQHVGVMTNSVADDLARLKEAGIEAVQQGHTGTGIRFAYVDTDDHPGGMIELIEAGPAITGFFRLVRDAAQGWGGTEPIRRMR